MPILDWASQRLKVAFVILLTPKAVLSVGGRRIKEKEDFIAVYYN
jgi:hypothetical protein